MMSTSLDKAQPTSTVTHVSWVRAVSTENSYVIIEEDVPPPMPLQRCLLLSPIL